MSVCISLCSFFDAYHSVVLQVRVSAVLTNAPCLLNLDCDHYINNSKALREAMCFMMDPLLGKRICYVQFPQRFDGIDRHDRYANRNTVFFDVSSYLLNMYFLIFSCNSLSFQISWLVVVRNFCWLKLLDLFAKLVFKFLSCL